MKTVHRHPRKKGFTLTELLIVILIIIVLAALSMMLIGRVRNMADKAAATRLLSQLQLANVSYAGDHNGDYINYQIQDEDGNRIGWWYQVPEFLEYYRGEVYDANGNPSRSVQPDMLDPKVVRAKKDRFATTVGGSFGLNNTGLRMGGDSRRLGFDTNSVTKPEQSMAFASSTDVRVSYPARFNWLERAKTDDPEGKTTDGGMAYRHSNKVLVVYYDGHISEMSEGELKEIDKNRGGRNSAFWSPIQN